MKPIPQRTYTMTREEQIAEKKRQIKTIEAQIKVLIKKDTARFKREKATNNHLILYRRILKHMSVFIQIRSAILNMQVIQSQPIAPDFPNGGMIHATGKELIIPHVPPEQRHNPDRD